MVVTPEVPALYQAKRIRESIQMMGLSTKRMKLVVNRAPRGLDMQSGELEEMIGMPVAAILPEDSRGLENCFVEPKTTVAAGRLCRELESLAARLTGRDEDKPKKRFLLFSRS